jgi:hypothetical protein
MFQSFAWNYAAACAFGDRERPYVAYTESDNGAALLPGAVIDKRFTLLGESLFDYRDVLVAGDVGTLHAGWSQVASLNMEFSSGALRADSNLSLWEGFTRNNYYAAPIVRPGEISGEEFGSEHGRLGRWSRRLQREGCAFRCYSGSYSEVVRFIYEKKASQPGDTGDSLFNDPKRVAFMVEICRTVGEGCEIFTVESAATLVAALVTFRDGETRRFYTIYFDRAWAKYSPGMVLVYEVTRRSLEAGMECDYMTGEHGYKMRFAKSSVPMYWVEAKAHDLATLTDTRHALAA